MRVIRNTNNIQKHHLNVHLQLKESEEEKTKRKDKATKI